MTIQSNQSNEQSNEQRKAYLMKAINPELKGRTCPLCRQKFDGYGNNPAPLRVKGQVCDDCNANRVIPARIRQMLQ